LVKLRKAATKTKRTATALEGQLREFLAHIDTLAERLTPKRRPQDRGEPECSPQELRTLAAINRQGALTMSEVAGRLEVRLSTASHTVDKLAAKGLVERKRASADRRVVQVQFSKRGQRINRFVVESRLAQGRVLLAALGPQERRILIGKLAKMALSK
jgi:DNA-binding MarR family transcriptional regulator